MPVGTANQYSSFNGYSSPPKMQQTGPPHSFEVEMGVSPEAFAPVFQFRKRHGEINWRKVAMIDVDRVARELDIDLLQEHIQTVAFCNIDAVSDLDPMFSKLFRLAQYMIEYMLHSQSSLQGIISELEGKLDVAAAQHNSALERIKEQESDVQKLKAENKKRRKMIEQQQMLIESGASSYYKCPHCEKAFMNASFLQGHMQRKHPGSVNYIGDVIAHSQREQSKLAGRLEVLDSDLQRERENFTEKLRKAEEDKAAWGARTRRDMQRWKKEEEGKWRKELETMKSTFLQEIEQLKNQETVYKNKITSLQMTMDERHSNLGELVDDIEGEKQKLTVYEQRIKSLEHTNQEKERQLRQLSAEMQNLKEQNKHAIAKHGKQMADTYDSQLRRLRDQVDEQSRRGLQRQPPVEPQEGSESYEEEDGDEEPDPGQREKEKKNIADQMRRHLQKLVDRELQQCGVDPRAEGISTQTLTNKLMVRKTERQRKAQKEPGFFIERDRLKRLVDKEALRRRGSPPRKRRSRTPSHLPRQRQFSRSPVVSRSLEQPRSPPSRPIVPAGRIDHPSPAKRTSDARQPVARKEDRPMRREELNTRFEEEDSPWDSDPSELQEVPGPSRQERPSRPSPPTDRQDTATPKTPVAGLVPPSTSKRKDSWDSDDLDDILSPETDVRDTRPKSGGTKVQQLGANIESQLQARSVTKPPAGAVDVFGGNKQPAGSSTTNVKRIESDDEDFSPISSLRDSPKPAPRGQNVPKVRQSATTVSSTGTMGTSVWGSGQQKPPANTKDGEEESDWDDISDL